MFPSRWEQLSFWETYWESPRSMSHSSQTWQLFLNLGPRRHFCICLVVINSTFSWALITCSHNHDSKHKGPTRDISVALLTFGLLLPTRLLNLKRNPCSCQFLHSLQDNTQECGYLYIYKYRPSILQLTTLSTVHSFSPDAYSRFSSISSVSNTTAQTDHFPSSLQYMCCDHRKQVPSQQSSVISTEK